MARGRKGKDEAPPVEVVSKRRRKKRAVDPGLFPDEMVVMTGPGGDGLLSVVTPASPIGRAVLGRRVGDVVDITVEGELREWQISFVS